jgi:DNA mismatch repair protein MutL
VSDRGAPWPISPAENKSVPVQDSLTAEDLQPVPLGAVGQRYLLFLEGGSLVIVDQHAAHERIRYDAIIAALRGAAAPSQELLVADVFRAEPQEVEGLAAGRDWLARVGFAVELFGPETLRIRAVPVWFRGDPRPAVRETLRDLAEHGGGDAIERHAHELAARLACRGAILSGRDVPRREQEDLLRSLLTTPGADTCPHGRPTWRRITGGELDRWFGRT